MGFELLEMNDDLYGLLNEVIRERDELIAEVQRLKEELGNAEEYGDCEHNYADCLKLEIKQARQERDEARKCAEEMRDLYAAEVDESKKAFPWPWEVQNERG